MAQAGSAAGSGGGQVRAGGAWRGARQSGTDLGGLEPMMASRRSSGRRSSLSSVAGRPAAPASRTTLHYIYGWYVIVEANRISGFEGWDREIVSLRCIWEGTRAGRYGDYSP